MLVVLAKFLKARGAMRSSFGVGAQEDIGQDGTVQAHDGELEEARRPVVMLAPVASTKAEPKDHEQTHLPYRSWCAHRVWGRGREDAHKRSI